MYLLTDAGHDGLPFPLARLLDRVGELVCQDTDAPWQVRHAAGSGPAVERLIADLGEGDPVVIAPAALFAIARDPDQRFDALVVSTTDARLRFGLTDAGVLFVDGDERLERQVVRRFRQRT